MYYIYVCVQKIDIDRDCALCFWSKGMCHSKEPVWTCESDAKARGSHQDAIPMESCKYTNIENFISASDLSAMKSVKIKHGSKKFSRWMDLIKKANFSKKAYCAQHLKMPPVENWRLLLFPGHLSSV